MSRKIKPRGPDELERFSILAARKYIEGRASSIQDAVLEIVKQEQGLSEDHVRRVVENTNKTVLQNMFQTEREKTQHVPLANAQEIIDVTFKEEAPQQENKTDDYAKPPGMVLDTNKEEREKVQKITDEAVSKIQEDPTTKSTYVPPQQKAAELQQKCDIVNDWISGQLGRVNNEIFLAEKSLEHDLKTRVLSREITLDEFDKVASEYPVIKKYMRNVMKDMNRTGEIYTIPRETVKMASNDDYAIDEEDSIVKATRQIEALQNQADSLGEVLLEISQKKEKADKALKSSINASST